MGPDRYKVWEEKCIYGIDVYVFMRKYLQNVKKSKIILEQRGFYVQWEHKTILEKSLTYIMGEQWKSRFPVEYEILKQDIEISNIMLILCIKYNSTLDLRIIDKMEQRIVKLEENDKKLFSSLINILTN